MESLKLFMNAQEVAEKCDISIASAYKIIKVLNKELSNMNKFVQNGKVQRMYFYSRIYGQNEENKRTHKLFISAKEISELCGIPVNTLYPKIRSSNQLLKKKGYITLCGKLPISYFKSEWLYNGNNSVD